MLNTLMTIIIRVFWKSVGNFKVIHILVQKYVLRKFSAVINGKRSFKSIHQDSMSFIMSDKYIKDSRIAAKAIMQKDDAVEFTGYIARGKVLFTIILTDTENYISANGIRYKSMSELVRARVPNSIINTSLELNNAINYMPNAYDINNTQRLMGLVGTIARCSTIVNCVNFSVSTFLTVHPESKINMSIVDLFDYNTTTSVDSVKVH